MTGRERTSFLISQDSALTPNQTSCQGAVWWDTALQRTYQPVGKGQLTGQTSSWAGTFWVICKARLALALALSFEMCWERVPIVDRGGSLERSLGPPFLGSLCGHYLKGHEGTETSPK